MSVPGTHNVSLEFGGLHSNRTSEGGIVVDRRQRSLIRRQDVGEK